MNEQRQYRLGTTFNVSFPDFPGFTETPRRFSLIQEIGKQDIVHISYPYQSNFYLKALKTGVPLKIKWKTEYGNSTFFGYVYEVKPKTARGKDREVILKAIGATLGAKETANNIWVNKTASQIVEEIAKKLKLKADITPSKVIFSQQSMINHTYWEKIQELARRIGYVAQVYGTELNFHPIDIMIDKSMSTVPIYFFVDAESPRFTELLEHTLDDFKPTVGDISLTSIFGKREKKISSIDPYSSKPYSYSSSPSSWKSLRSSVKDPLFSESLTSTITSTPAMTRAIAEAQSKLSRYSIFAEGKGQGDPRVAPYKTIEVRGTGEFTDGYWIVTRVEHHITWAGKYEVEFSCMTDGVGKNKKTGSRPEHAKDDPIRDIEFELKSKVSSKPATTTLSSKAAMIKQTSGGFKVTPRRWAGK
jgi:phage protein D